MWNTIRTRIFLPTVLILFLLPISMFIIIHSVTKNYMEQESAFHAETIITYIQNEALSISKSAPELDKEEASELLGVIRSYMRNQQPQAHLLIYNSKLEEIYPTKEVDTDLFSEYWRNWLTTDAPQSDTLYFKEIEQKLYAVKFWRTFNQNRTGGRYYVSYNEIPDTLLLLSQTTRHLLIMLSILFIISLIIVCKISDGIVRSVEKLCKETEHIGTPNSNMEYLSFSIPELEKLRQSFCTMDMRLKKTQKEKEQIFQNISHDLKTPLASIIGFTTGLSNGIVKDPKNAYEIILEESYRINRMLDSILTLSKLDTHAWISNCHSIILEDFLLEQLEITRGAAGGKMLHLEPITDSAENLSIVTDAELLTRIIQNILSNCIRYAEHTIQLHLGSTSNYAVITISDDGPGFDPNTMKYIFERYYHGSNGNHGLGMSIVKSGIEYLGGYIEISNKTADESGAIFRLYLPLNAPS